MKAQQGTQPVVHTALGAVAGVDAGVLTFRGIPYAEPADGERRWRPPVPIGPWPGTLDATEFGPDCPQPESGSTQSRAPRQGEDCLRLNVWTPSLAPDAPLPVLVYVHGGSFMTGSASSTASDGAALAAKGAVVVTVGYRTGMLGFLSHPELTAESPHGASGNYGMLDMIEALRWLRQHVAAFGGDPAKVTVFGCSAGAAMISLLLVSPPAAGLFDQAVLQSPGGFRALMTLGEAEATVHARLGLDLAELRGLDAGAVVELTSKLNPTMRRLAAPRVLRAIVDGWVLPDTESPVFAAGAAQLMPVIVGSVSDEGSSMTAGWPVDSDEALADVLGRDFGEHTTDLIAGYRADGAQSARDVLAGVFGDTQFNYGARRVADEMARAGQPVYRYVFTHRAEGQTSGPHHGGDVPFVFGTVRAGQNGHTAADEAVGDRLGQAFVDFAATGDPNGTAPAWWPRFTTGDRRHVEIAATTRVGTDWRTPQLDRIESILGGRPLDLLDRTAAPD